MHQVEALAKAINITVRFELPSILAELETHKLISRDKTAINVLGVTSAATLRHTASIFESVEPFEQEKAVIELAEKASSANDKWTVYNTENSGLPDNRIDKLENDGSGGVWIGIAGAGFVHLTFSQKNALCPILDDDKCEKLLTSKRAAIIIAGGGSDKTNTLWDTTAEISDNIYKMLSKRGFDNDEIYYLSPQSYADFNGDGLDDCIVDAPATSRCRLPSVENPISERPLTVNDVRQALAWAKTRGQLDQPLYLFFINHGTENRFIIAKNTYLDVQAFKAILDDYQNETGNQLVLVIDTLAPCCKNSSLPIVPESQSLPCPRQREARLGGDKTT